MEVHWWALVYGECCLGSMVERALSGDPAAVNGERKTE
jgi:hypothetical protein